MKAFKTTRAGELVMDKVFDNESIVPQLDSICPGWNSAMIHFLDEDDVLYEIGDVFVRGWDLTGYINVKTKR